MTRSTLLLLAVGLTPSLPAQNKTERAQVEWGPSMEIGENGAFGDVLHEDEEFLYMSVFLKKELFITKYDQQFHSKYQKVLPMEIDKKDHTNEGIFFLGEKIMVFSSFYDKKADELGLYLRTFKKADMSPVERISKIYSIPAEKSRNTGSFSIQSSPADKFLLVTVGLPRVKDANEEFGVRVYNSEAELHWERKVELPYNDTEFSRERLRVDDDGSVLLLGVKYDSKREAKEKTKKGEVTYLYHLMVLKDGDSALEDNPIQVPGKFLQDMTFAMGADGDIICGGFWGNLNSWNARGAYFLRIDRKTKAIAHESFKEFDTDFITAYMTEKEEKKATKKAEKKGQDLEMYKFELDDIVRRDDGGAILIGEQAYNYTVCYTDSRGNTRCTTHYIHNDIIVVNIDPEGDIEWASKIPKRQHTANDGGFYSSYALAVKGDRMYTVFNDSGKNLFLNRGDKVAQFELKGDEALITLATIDQDGHTHREALLSPEKRDAILRPKVCFQMDDDRMFIYAQRKKEYRYGMITFE